MIKLGESPQNATRQQILNKKMRDTITGTNERVFIMEGNDLVYTYTPVQGDQRATISADCTAKCPDASKAIAYAYHARSLAKAGKGDEAKTYIGKAKAAVAQYEPASEREGITKFIEGIEKGLGK